MPSYIVRTELLCVQYYFDCLKKMEKTERKMSQLWKRKKEIQIKAMGRIKLVPTIQRILKPASGFLIQTVLFLLLCHPSALFMTRKGGAMSSVHSCRMSYWQLLSRLSFTQAHARCTEALTDDVTVLTDNPVINTKLTSSKPITEHSDTLCKLTPSYSSVQKDWKST
jgi:hypothetical protein